MINARASVRSHPANQDMSSKATDEKCHFLALPLEVRREIYSQLFFDHPYSGKPSTDMFGIDAMTLRRAELEIGLQTDQKEPPLHPEILHVCHACLQEATPILCSKVILNRNTRQDASPCVPSVRRLGTRNLSLIQVFNMRVWSSELQQVWVDVCEIVDLMPELWRVSILACDRQRYEIGAPGTSSAHAGDLAEKNQSDVLAAQAWLVESIKPKLRIHRHLSKIVVLGKIEDILRDYDICTDRQWISAPSDRVVCPTLLTC